ncbi:hypothetical protein [Corallococcus sp. Z5C101001]|uniref:hypothetical protein n=1 Tax=Corallococcus sp. Z5C101001 TaxID=2596829 RepID=UPI00117F3E90|nr:hypothetical protein [Corallococcus sp. Z5C101001]TSC33907.1 hypothetical protein FOF48_02335 [Corallococcus sp. Z5C101001]
MSFFEVLSPVPRKIDMGGDLPLRFTTRPLLGRVVWPLLGFVVFVVLPVGYALDQRMGVADLREDWLLPLSVTLGLFVSVTHLVRCLRTRLEVVVTNAQVSLRGAGALSAFTWDEPLASYTRLDCERRHHPDWIGAQDEYCIAMAHRENPERNIVVHWGRDARRFEDRLARYAQLLRLPIRREQRALAEQPRRAAAR